VALDANNKPVRTPLVKVRRGRKQPPTDWVTVFGDVVEGTEKGPR
jgi:hypothetical protein